MDKAKKFRRFYGTVEMDAQRLVRDVGHTADEVVRHLARLDGAKVKITLEIEAEIPNGAPDEVVRTVLENCKTLKFDANEFETE